MLSHQRSLPVKRALLDLSNSQRKELVRAVLILNTSLSQTIGANWLDKVSGAEIPYDIFSILTGNLIPDEKGICQINPDRR